jgi:hypothetical protein
MKHYYDPQYLTELEHEDREAYWSSIAEWDVLEAEALGRENPERPWIFLRIRKRLRRNMTRTTSSVQRSPAFLMMKFRSDLTNQGGYGINYLNVFNGELKWLSNHHPSSGVFLTG